MNRRSPIIRIGSLTISCILACSMLCLPARAATSDEILDQIGKLEEQQEAATYNANVAKENIGLQQEKMKETLDKKSKIDQELANLRTKIGSLKKEIDVCEEKLRVQTEKVSEAEKEHNQLCLKYKDRIRAMEETRDVRYWSVVFKANSILDLLDRIEMQREIAKADEEMMSSLKETSLKLKEEQEILQEEERQLKTKQIDLINAENSLKEKSIEIDILIQEISANIDAYEALVQSAEEESNLLVAQLIQARTDYNNAKAEEEAAKQESTKPQPPQQDSPSEEKPVDPAPEVEETPNEEGDDPEPDKEDPNDTEDDYQESDPVETSWVCPVDWYVLTSEFGYRVHPIHGTTSFHNGIDMAGNEGMPIYASRSGTVIAAYSDYIGGEMVIIDHGDGTYQSVYMHMTHYIVSEGDYISQGQVIGYMGSTGWSTGDHLHFSIIENGEYVNPLNYI